MTVINLVNSLLESKIVQWVLLSCFICSIIFIGLLEFKYYGLKLENALLAKENATVNSALQVQNQAIKRMAEQTKLAEENLKQAVKKASKIALETQTILKPIVEYQYIGTCDEKVTQALELIQKVD